ncbi:MAG: carbon starvation protein A [Myxococcales bacterium]|nr:carbon starvation protein A [Myxococcales bacterium]MCB9530824.1 carbon starvation protein A [Myxococcales bacterium]
MPAIVLMTVALVAVTVAYRTYGTFVARRLGLDDSRPTPAHTRADGVDFVATRSPVVLGHHFASIAGAGPIVGPIVAASFGWLPAFLWILFGAVFFGAVHDLTTLTASIRHGGRTIGDIVEDYIGVTGKRLFVIFSLAALLLVVGVFTDIVAKTFVARPVVAWTSALLVIVSVAFGVATNRWKIPLGPATVVGLLGLVASVAIGSTIPLEFTHTTWVLVISGYIAVAAVAPVWVLLQPRDYLNSFLLYAMLAAGVVGLFVAHPTLELDAFTGFQNESLGFIFPILFVTVACGAISGFHSLVASGTTSKQLDRETDAKFIGYGGMLLEGVLAVLALIAAGVLSRDAHAAQVGNPIAVFSHGVGGFMSAIGIPESAGVTFVALSVSAFALTSLDTCTRLARLLLAELVTPGHQNSGAAVPLLANRYLSTAIVVALGAGLTLSGKFTEAWPVFGAANQLLAALSLLSVAVWLNHTGVRSGFVVVPMVFMFAVTLGALAQLLWTNLQRGNPVLTTLAATLLGLAIVLIGLAARSLSRAAAAAAAR